MSTKYWISGAAAVAQISEGGIDSVDATPADNTFTVTIGGVAVSVAGNTSAGQTATDLVAALNASTHPYFSGITWSVQSTDNIRGVADTAGVPFVATLSKSGAGTGTVTNFGGTGTNTAATGPHHWDEADNWSDGAVPVNTDDVFIDRGNSILWGLDQNSVTLDSLTIMQSFTGKIGLRSDQFATSLDAETTDEDAQEYRQSYLKIKSARTEIGVSNNAASASGSGRIKLDNQNTSANSTIVHNTASSSSDTGLPAVRLLAGSANSDIFVRLAPGGVGIASDLPTETSTIGDLAISDTSTTSRVYVGRGTTLTTFNQSGGNNLLNAAATITSVEANGGQLQMEGDYTITTLTIDGAIVKDNHVKTGGNAVTTCNLESGELNLLGSLEARTYSVLNPNGGTLKSDKDVVTVTTLNQPSGQYQITVQ